MQSMSTNSRGKISIILILGALATITPFAIDLYLPAFPQIAMDLNTNISTVSLSVSSYFIGLALGQIFYGPLLDRYGRKKPLYAGMLIFLLATVGCIYSGSIETLIVLRFVQALGGCVAQVASMTLVRDLFPMKESAKVISLLVLVLGVAPLIAPPIGSFVMLTLGWKWIFIILAILVSLIFLMTSLFLPEGRKPDPTVSLKISTTFRTFCLIFKEPEFHTYALAGAFSFTGLFVYIAASPIIFMNIFKVSPQVYGGIFALLSVGFILGSQLNIFLSRKVSNEQIFLGALIVQTTLGFVFCAGALIHGYGLGMTVLLLFGILASLGASYPNAAALALRPFSKHAGSAAALLGFLQIGIAATVSICVGLIESNIWPVAAILFVTAAIALACFYFGRQNILTSVEDLNELSI